LTHNLHLDSTWHHPPDQIAIGDDEVHCWRVGLAQPESVIRELVQLLNQEELARAARFHFSRDHNRFVVARAGLRIILSRYLKTNPAKIQFSYSAYGKPALAGDHSANDLQFNLGHSHEVAVYAFSLKRQLGIDIEHLRPEVSGDEIAQRFFATAEVAALREVPSGHRTEAFFNCWTRKEAYIKARGEGLTFPLADFAVSMTPDEPARLLTVRDAPQEVTRWFLRELSPGRGYVAALAVEGSDWDLKFWEGNSLLESTDYADYTE
jgi:4'-phosphopantetheinyl transferase